MVLTRLHVNGKRVGMKDSSGVASWQQLSGFLMERLRCRVPRDILLLCAIDEGLEALFLGVGNHLDKGSGLAWVQSLVKWLDTGGENIFKKTRKSLAV